MDLVYYTWENACLTHSTVSPLSGGGSLEQQKIGDLTELPSYLRKERVQKKPVLCLRGHLSCSCNWCSICSLYITFCGMWHFLQLQNSQDSTLNFWFTPAHLRFYGFLRHGWMTSLAARFVTGRTFEMRFLKSFWSPPQHADGKQGTVGRLLVLLEIKWQTNRDVSMSPTPAAPARKFVCAHIESRVLLLAFGKVAFWRSKNKY